MTVVDESVQLRVIPNLLNTVRDRLFKPISGLLALGTIPGQGCLIVRFSSGKE